MKKLKTLCGIVGIGLMSLTASAQDSLLRESYLNHLKKLEKYTPITKQEIQSDTSRFNMINSGLKEYLNKIYIIDKKDFPEGSEPGHTHVYERILCLRKDYTNRIVFHELGHNRHLSLENINSDLTEEWKKIANFEYGKHNFYFSKDKFKEIALIVGTPMWKEGTCGPKNGCLHPLAGGDIYEDLAFFVECLGYEETPKDVKELYLFFKEKFAKTNFPRKLQTSHEGKSFQDFPRSEFSRKFQKEHFENSSKKEENRNYSNFSEERKEKILKDTNGLRERSSDIDFYQNYVPLYFADTTDRRYQQKLDLLKEYNFFTKEEHKKLSNNLGSLNYLLKKEN